MTRARMEYNLRMLLRAHVRSRVLALAALSVIASGSAGRAQRGFSSDVSPLDPTGRISYFIADGIPRSGFRDGDADLALWALREWERKSRSAVQFERIPDEAASLLRIYWLPSAATNIG